MRIMGLVVSAVAVTIAAGCAVRLGGGTFEYVGMAVQAEQATAAAAAAQIRAANADLVLLAADQDSAWFASVAGEAGMALSGPGRTGQRSLALLTSPQLEMLGDTSMYLSVPSGGRLHMQDALYRIQRESMIDLMYVRFEDVIDLRDATRTLLEYVATDVGANVALLLAVEAPTPAATDTVAGLMRALYPTTWECLDNGVRNDATLPGVRLFYGPRVRVRCADARRLEGPGEPVAADLVVTS
jgi:hypothetical protein